MMYRKRNSGGFVVLLCLVLSICDSIAGDSANVRVSHAYPGGPLVDFLANGHIIATNIGFTHFSSYFQLPTGDNQISIVSSGTNSTLFSKKISLGSGTHSIVASGELSSNSSHPLDFIVFDDDLKAPPTSVDSTARFVHLSPDGPALELWINGKSEGILNYGESKYITFKSGNHLIEMYVDGTNVKILEEIVVFLGGYVSSVWLEGLVDTSHPDRKLQLVKIVDATYRYVDFRFLHSSPDTPSVDVRLNGDLLFEGISFTEFTDYITKTLVSTQVEFELSLHGASGVPFLVQNVSLPNDIPITISALGYKNPPSHSSPALYLEKYAIGLSAPENGGKSCATILHVSPDAGAIDVYVNDILIPTWKNLQFGAMGGVLCVDAGALKIALKEAGTPHVSYMIDISVKGGSTYLLVAEGLVSSVDPQQNFRLNAHREADFQYATWRFSNMVPTSPALDIYVDGVLEFSNVLYGSITEYKDLSLTIGNRNFTFKNTGTSTVFFTKTIDIEDYDAIYTIGLVGKIGGHPNALDVKYFFDDLSPPVTSSISRVRFLQVSPEAPTVYILIDGQGVTEDLEYLESSAYVDVVEGNHMVGVVNASTTSTIFSVPFYFGGGAIYSMALEGLFSRNDSNGIQLVQLDDATYTYCNLQFGHLSPDGPSVDIYLDDQLAFGSVSYKEFTIFHQFVSGDIDVSMKQANTNNTLVSMTISFEDGESATILAVGSSNSSLFPVALKKVRDDMTPPASSAYSAIRFVHASPALPPIDIRVNGQLLATALNFSSATLYFPLLAQFYMFSFFRSGTSEKLISIQDTLQKGSLSTLALTGFPSSLTSATSEDIAFQYVSLRVLHASPDTQQVSFQVAGMTPASFASLSFPSVSPYVEFFCGLKDTPCTLNISVISQGATLLSALPTLSTGSPNSISLSGLASSSPSSPQARKLVAVLDKFTPPSAASTVLIRMVNFVPDSSLLDLKTGDEYIVQALPYLSASDFQLEDPGHYTYSVYQNNSVLASTKVSTNGGSVYTIFAFGLVAGIGNSAVSLQMERDFLAPSLVSLRFFHLSPDSPPISLLLNAFLFSETPEEFGKASEYYEIKEGNYSASFISTVTDSTVYSAPVSFSTASGPNYSIFLLGLANSSVSLGAPLPQPYSVLVSTDKIDLPDQGKIKIRFLHSAPGIAAVNLRANGNDIMKNVSYGQISSYYIMDTATYSFELYSTASPSSAILKDIKFDWNRNGVYTLILKGLKPDISLTSYDDNIGPPVPSPGNRTNVGKIIGIVFGSIIGAILLVVLGVFIYKRTHKPGYSSIPDSP